VADINQKLGNSQFQMDQLSVAREAFASLLKQALIAESDHQRQLHALARSSIPLACCTFAPDVPSNALGPNEYNSGLNVEADVRGIKKIYGEQEILELHTRQRNLS
jgi:hypothetical protein